MTNVTSVCAYTFFQGKGHLSLVDTRLLQIWKLVQVLKLVGIRGSQGNINLLLGASGSTEGRKGEGRGRKVPYK